MRLKPHGDGIYIINSDSAYTVVCGLSVVERPVRHNEWWRGKWDIMSGREVSEASWVVERQVRYNEWWRGKWDIMSGGEASEAHFVVERQVRHHEWWRGKWGIMSHGVASEISWVVERQVRHHEWWRGKWDIISGGEAKEATWVVGRQVRHHEVEVTCRREEQRWQPLSHTLLTLNAGCGRLSPADLSPDISDLTSLSSLRRSGRPGHLTALRLVSAFTVQ